MKIEKIDISEIKPNPSNPRSIKADKHAQLVKSIKDFPQMLELRPLIIDKKGFVIGGNMRLAAAKEAGLKKIPVMRAESLTPAQIKEFIIKDNVGFGEWDWDALANEWDVEKLEEWGLDIPGFQNAAVDAKDDDYEIPEDIRTDIKLGDLLEIGLHRLICGDAIEKSSWESLSISAGAIVFTSPPYNTGGSSKIQASNEKKRGSKYISIDDNLTQSDYEKFLQDILDVAVMFCEGATINVQPLSGNKSALFKWVSNNENRFNDIITWDKGAAQPAMAKSVLTSRFEWLCIFSRSNKSRTIPMASWRGTITNVYQGPPQRANGNAKTHNATFPVHLPSFVIADLMNRCTGVVDPFMGSGTTMVAAHQLGRKAYGIEIDPHYCQVIVDRMLKLDPNLEVKKNGKPYKTGS